MSGGQVYRSSAPVNVSREMGAYYNPGGEGRDGVAYLSTTLFGI